MLNQESKIELTKEYFIQQSELYGKEFYADVDFSFAAKSAGPETLSEFLPELRYILSKYKNIVYTMVGHVGNGNFHIIPLMNLKKEENRALIPSLMEQVHKLVFSYKGSMSAEHNDGIIRTPFLEDMFGKEVVELFLKTKQIFDPQNIFNPGKKTNGDIDFAFSHLSLKNK
ncbi:hypothetical protein IID10_11835 [candidate division KSB1 bacterium]|nr:hypothetical protein [candidate division KSB1 bacterium]